jgi:hypothetical protein
MRNLREAQQAADPQKPTSQYLPMTFDSMISFLSYCTTRHELKAQAEVLANCLKYIGCITLEPAET